MKDLNNERLVMLEILKFHQNKALVPWQLHDLPCSKNNAKKRFRDFFLGLARSMLLFLVASYTFLIFHFGSLNHHTKNGFRTKKLPTLYL